MKTSLEFMGGVSAAGGGFYARAVAYTHGLFLMDGRTSEFSVFHKNLTFISVDYSGDGKFCGWATNRKTGDHFLYEIEVETGELKILSYITRPHDINYVQGVSSFDAVNNQLVLNGFRWLDPESGTIEQGLYRIDLSSGRVHYDDHDGTMEWHYFNVTAGNITYFTAESHYSLQTGVMAYDEINKCLYTVNWLTDPDSGEILGQQILKLVKSGDTYEVSTIGEVKQEFVSDIVYDSENRIFFAVVASGDADNGYFNRVVVLEFSGNVFDIGSHDDDRYNGSNSTDNYYGMGGSDELIGNRGDDNLVGGEAADLLSGGGDEDKLRGGSGKDRLIGGAGKDTLSGGSSDDAFIFRTAAESATDVTNADIVVDFRIASDKINLNAIDAFASSGANDTFIWKGTSAFSSTSKGEVRYEKFNNSGTSNDYTMVWIDTDRDSGAEMAIRLTGLHSLTESDFIL